MDVTTQWKQRYSTWPPVARILIHPRRIYAWVDCDLIPGCHIWTEAGRRRALELVRNATVERHRRHGCGTSYRLCAWSHYVPKADADALAQALRELVNDRANVQLDPRLRDVLDLGAA